MKTQQSSQATPVGCVAYGTSGRPRAIATFATALLISSLLIVTGCDHSRASTLDVDTSRGANFSFQKELQTSLQDEGQAAYERYCIGCHGALGDGRGEAAGFLNPHPRNFQLASFKFNSRGFGRLPTDDDLRRTIRNGLRGSAMPSFELLPSRTIDSLIAYIKTFSPKWKDAPSDPPIPIVEDPYRNNPDKTEAIQRGEAIYHGFANCWSCHAAYVPEEKIAAYRKMFGSESQGVRPDLDQPVAKPNDQGELLYPPDFRRDFVKSGASVDDLYRAIGGGITGSAMPNWLESIEYKPAGHDKPITNKSDIWAMAYYVQNLIKQKPAKLKEGQFIVRSRAVELFPHGLPAPVVAAEDQEATPAPQEEQNSTDAASQPESQPPEEHK